MNEIELKMLWQTTQQQLQEGWKLNRANAAEITRMKIDKALSSMRPAKLFALLVGVVWVLVLGGFVGTLFFNTYNSVSPFFLYSAATQVLLTALAIGVYGYQLVLISKVDFSDTVLAIQKRLSRLKMSTLNVTRILFLQLPLWTVFYWNDTMFASGNGWLWTLQAVITAFFAFAAVWLFFNIRFENRDKKWFQWIFRGSEWQPLLYAMELLGQVEEYQQKSE